MTYPVVLTEDATIEQALAGRSLARVGEGELRIAIGWPIKSQRRDVRLASEMRTVMAERQAALVCLPRLWKGMPAEPFWRQFAGPKYDWLYGDQPYGSAFVSRPDVAHTADTPGYWEKVEQLWRGKDVVLASRSTKVLKLSAAASVRFVACPAVDAFDEIDRIEAEIGTPAGPVLVALGATATVLCARLARKGVHAIDVGHLGRFMSSAGAYGVERQALISDGYRDAQRAMHRRPEGYGGSGRKRRDEVMAFAAEIGAAQVLDYGCGQGTLKTALVAAGYTPDVMEYDPAIKGKDALPKPAELVCCTDVLEHVEPERLDAVLAHLLQLTGRAAYLLIATRKANKTLPDGRNAHLIVKPAAWWVERVVAAGFVIDRAEAKEGHDLKLWCSKGDAA